MNMQALRVNLQPLLAWHNLPACTFEPSKTHQAIHAAGWLAHAVQCAQCERAGTPPPRDVYQHLEKWLGQSPRVREFTQDPRVNEIITQVLQGHAQAPAAQNIAQQLGQEPYLTLRKLQQQQPFCACTQSQLRAYIAWQDELPKKVRRVPFELALLHITHLHMQQDIDGLRDFLQMYGPYDRSIARRLVNLLRARGITAEMPERAKPPPPPVPPAPPAPEPRKPVDIDFAQLAGIREQAAEMTELLIIDDEIINKNAECRNVVSIEEGATLRQVLSQAQVATVNAIINGGTASELEIDAINEIAWEILGDNLIEDGQMIEEYMQAWKEGSL